MLVHDSGRDNLDEEAAGNAGADQIHSEGKQGAPRSHPNYVRARQRNHV